ncbi:MAG: pantetheine-phosphate adenylyltransferase [Burkholderiaceae bacterium]
MASSKVDENRAQQAHRPPSQRLSVSAVYPGTFDPITLGHEDLVRRAVTMFDRVVIGVAVGHHKRTMFTLDERIRMAQETLGEIAGVEVVPFSGLVVEFAAAQEACVMLRGLRSSTDYDYESQLAGMNRRLAPAIETVFLPPGDAVQHISSTLVREIAKLGGDVSAFVAVPVLSRLHARVVQIREEEEATK